MTKITLEFSLPEDFEEYELTRNAQKYYNALWAITQKFREMRKYGQVEELTWSQGEEIIWDKIREEGIDEL